VASRDTQVEQFSYVFPSFYFGKGNKADHVVLILSPHDFFRVWLKDYNSIRQSAEKCVWVK
jgi:hypothetical protein